MPMIDKARCLLVAADGGEMLAVLLRADARELLTAASGVAALDLLATHDFTLVLVDAQLPEMQDYKLAESIRAIDRAKNVPLLVINAGASAPMPVFLGFDGGAVDVLFAPVHPPILRQKVALLLGQQLQRRQFELSLRARDDVLFMVSHDLRTPLSVVHTTASMLLNPKYQLAPQQVREQHERIRRNVDVMNRMLGDLSDMAALRSGKLDIDAQPLSVEEVLREAVAAQAAPARDRGRLLSYDASADTLRVKADRTRLLQLFDGLLGNAIKACKAGDRISVSSRAGDNRALIEIVDTGSGMRADDRPQFFGPFEAGKKPPSGTGLGPYLWKGIVDAHGGEIRCSSGSNGGTIFEISLPLAP